MYTPFEIADAYQVHMQNLGYLVREGNFARLCTYLSDYMVWFVTPVILAIVAFYGLSFALEKITLRSKSHGSARWATFRELKKGKFLRTKEQLMAGGDGVVLGMIKHWFKTYYVCNRGIHTNLTAPTRSGKGIGSINTTTLTYDGSMFVNDPKGELYCINRRNRATRGDRVYLVDPFSVVKNLQKKGLTANMTEEQATSCKFNPLANVFTIRNDCYSRTQELVKSFCINTSGKEDYFDKQAKNYIITAILYLCECRDKKIDCGFPATFPAVRDFLSMPTEQLMEHAAKMLESPIPAVRNGGSDMIKTYADGEGEKVWSSILSSVTSYIAMLDDPNLREFFSDHTVDTHLLAYKHCSIFYVSPTSDVTQGIAIARLLYADALLWTQKEHPEVEGLPKLKKNVLFIMDEFPQLGKFEIIENGMAIYMGLGVTFFIISQGGYQLEKEYGKNWRVFQGNSISAYLGSRDKDTAKDISDTIGNETIHNKSFSNRGMSSSEAGRALITPDEIIEMGPAHPIVMIGEGRPAKTNQLKYFNIPWLDERADPNPYYDPNDK